MTARGRGDGAGATPGRETTWARLRGPIALVAVTLALYARAPWCGFMSDDRGVLVDRPTAPTFSSVVAAFTHHAMHIQNRAARPGADTYRPLAIASFLVEDAISGRSLLVHHVGNVLIHVANVLLVAAVAGALGLSRRASFAAALLFAAHPAISEAVYWINGRSDPLFVLFLLAALLAWVRGRLWLVAPLFFVSTLAKETAFAVAPAVVLLLPKLRRASAPRSYAALLAPWVAGGVAGIGLRMLALRHMALSDGGGHVAFALARLPEVIADALLSLARPVAEMPVTLFDRYRTIHPAGFAVGCALLALMLALGVVALRRGREVEAWAVASAFLGLAPIALLTFFGFYAGWGRYLYAVAPMACIGAAAVLVDRVLPALREPWRGAALAGAIGYVVVGGVSTFLAASDWRDERAFAEALVRDRPGESVGYMTLGTLDAADGNPALAVADLRRAAEIVPTNPAVWSRLAVLLMTTDQREQAYVAAGRSLALRPGDADTTHVAAVGLLEHGKERDAADALLRVLLVDPTHEGARATIREAAGHLGPASSFVATLRAAVDGDARYAGIASTVRAALE
jgi:tetratricopeptide (TPR) repeat protein